MRMKTFSGVKHAVSMCAHPLVFASVFFTSVVLSGCGTSPQQTTRSSANSITERVPQLTRTDILLFTQNGFEPGIWGADCKDPSAMFHRYVQQGNSFGSQTIVNNKVIATSEFYDVKKITDGVIRFKAKIKETESGKESLYEYKTGFLKDQRLTFDSKMIVSSGSSAGKEVVLIRDGLPVNRNTVAEKNQENTIKPVKKCF